MATTLPKGQKGLAGAWHRLFAQHPHSLGMSWAAHGAGAFKIGAQLIGAGVAAVVHAAVPGLFTDTAGRTVSQIYDHIQRRKANSAEPDNWSDYEI